MSIPTSWYGDEDGWKYVVNEAKLWIQDQTRINDDHLRVNIICNGLQM